MMSNNLENITNSIEWNKVDYIWNKFFEELWKIDENKLSLFSSILAEILFDNISAKNALNKVQKIKNYKQARYSKHIIQTFWYYILVKYNNEKINVINKEQWDFLVSNAINNICSLDENQIKNLILNIFSLTKKSFWEINTAYKKIQNINDLVKNNIHQTIEITDKDFHDIIIKKDNPKYLPKILQYTHFPKNMLDWNDSIFLNNIYSDLKNFNSNFSTFIDLFRLKSTFSNLSEIYSFLWNYLKLNKKQNTIDLYRYFDQEKWIYNNWLYLVWEDDYLNYESIFFQWFIENKKNNELNRDKIHNNKYIWENTLNISDITKEYSEILSLVWDELKNKASFKKKNWNIIEHLEKISLGFYDIEQFIFICRNLNKIPNSFSDLELKDIFINIDLLKNGIMFTYNSKINNNIDSFIPISKISFIKDENWNIIISEHFSNLISILNKYIEWNINIDNFDEEKLSILKSLILNWILSNLSNFIKINKDSSKLLHILNNFNVLEKQNITEQKYDPNIFPIKNLKNNPINNNLDSLLSNIKENTFIWKDNEVFPTFSDCIKNKDSLDKLTYIRENAENISKDIFIQLLKNKNIKNFSELNLFIKSNIYTISIVLKDEEYSKILRSTVNAIIYKILSVCLPIKLNTIYIVILDKVISFFELSEKFDFNFKEKEFEIFLKKQDPLVLFRYLWLNKTKNKNKKIYDLIISHLNNNMENILNNLIYFNQTSLVNKFNEKKYINILWNIDNIFETLSSYIWVIFNYKKNIFNKIIVEKININIIQHFQILIINELKNNNFNNNENEETFYRLCYWLKKNLKILEDMYWINWLNTEKIDINERIQEYDYKKYINRNRKKIRYNLNKEIKLYEDININEDEYEDEDINEDINEKNKTKFNDIYISLNSYINSISLKIEIYNHIKSITNETKEEEIEKFLFIFEKIDKVNIKYEVILIYLNKLNQSNINLFKSEKIKFFLNNYLEYMIITSNKKNILLNYLSLLWFYDYVYFTYIWKDIFLNKENIDFIKNVLEKNKNIYETVEKEIVKYSKNQHYIEITKIQI